MSEDIDDVPTLDLRMGSDRARMNRLLQHLRDQGAVQFPPGVRLIISEGSPSREEPSIFDRVARLESGMSEIASKIDRLESSLKSQTDTKEEALAEYRTMLEKIPEVHSAYAFETPTGLDIWTLHSAHSEVKLLDRVSEIQVNLDKRFPSLYFDFNLLKVSEVSGERLTKARKFYQR